MNRFELLFAVYILGTATGPLALNWFVLCLCHDLIWLGLVDRHIGQWWRNRTVRKMDRIEVNEMFNRVPMRYERFMQATKDGKPVGERKPL